MVYTNKIALSICLIFLPFLVFSQSYHSAFGLRIGTDFGLTYQQRVGNRSTVEGILQTGLFDRSGQIAALYEHHTPLVSKGLNFYMGAGPQVGWLENRNEGVVKATGGLALIGGAEMTLGSIVLSYDIKPNINVFGNVSLINFDTALSVRKVITKRSKYNKKRKGWFRSDQSSKPQKAPKKKKTHRM